ncbi:ECF transporter S component [Clostridium sp. D2Q-11]|uniref:ECF transporter S component n=1 Tax=Anaeromonas frigoriresistens TaxID=2683708 RepID=A0A942Z956_9FIRM|nr:ECF transporter S component [Anaeromonas frigoriresistens]MBS4538749.1 ECF transporter S component [Anaeromonas frigoriresistens]
MDTKKLVRTALLLSLALIFQIGFREFAQPLVGPLVNMTLILATLISGPISGIFIGTMTPMIAFMVGIIRILPIIPIIITGNIVLVVVFYLIHNKMNFKGKDWSAIIISSFIKFGFLAMAVRMILPYFMPKIPSPIITAFSLPQLFTALIGGALALILYPLIKKQI